MAESGEDIEVMEETLWETMLLFEGYLFRTVKGNAFRYCIKGKELFIDRKVSYKVYREYGIKKSFEVTK